MVKGLKKSFKFQRDDDSWALLCPSDTSSAIFHLDLSFRDDPQLIYDKHDSHLVHLEPKFWVVNEATLIWFNLFIICLHPVYGGTAQTKTSGGAGDGCLKLHSGYITGADQFYSEV